MRNFPSLNLKITLKISNNCVDFQGYSPFLKYRIEKFQRYFPTKTQASIEEKTWHFRLTDNTHNI